VARIEAQLGRGDGVVLDVVISERNLLTLLSKLYTPGTRREFLSGDVPPGVAFARIRAESDQQHYNSPSRRGVGPGPMHPVTEHVLRAIHDALDQLEADGAPADWREETGSSS